MRWSRERTSWEKPTSEKSDSDSKEISLLEGKMDPISYDRVRPSAPPAFDAPFSSAPAYYAQTPFSSYPTAPSAPPYSPDPSFQIVPRAPPTLCVFCGGPNPSIYRLPCGCSVYAHTSCSSSQSSSLTQCPICRSTFLHFPAPNSLQQQVQILQGEQEAVARRRALRGGCCLILVVVGILVWVIVRYVGHVE